MVKIRKYLGVVLCVQAHFLPQKGFDGHDPELNPEVYLSEKQTKFTIISSNLKINK